MDVQSLFDKIIRDGWEEVDRWQRERQTESLHLEFKRVSPAAPSGKLAIEDQTRLARALCGFANIEGGVYVLGIDAKRSEDDGLDCVRGIVPVPRARAVANFIDSRIGWITHPKVPGVNIAVIPQPNTADAGIVVLCVPPSDGGPHRAEGVESEANGRFYMRTASNTTEMPYSVLAAMFGVRPQPKLVVAARIAPDDPRKAWLFVRNIGRGTAGRICLRLRLDRTDDNTQRFGALGGISPWEEAPALARRMTGENRRGEAEYPHMFILPEPHLLYPLDARPVCYVGRMDQHEALITGRLDAPGMRPSHFTGRVPIAREELHDAPGVESSE